MEYRRIWLDEGHHENDYVPKIGVALSFTEHLEGRFEAGYNFIDDTDWRPHNYMHFDAHLEYHVRHLDGLALLASIHYDEHAHVWRQGVGLAYHF